jgi:hypothetical protein
MPHTSDAGILYILRLFATTSMSVEPTMEGVVIGVYVWIAFEIHRSVWKWIHALSIINRALWA